MSEYVGSIELIGGLKQKNNGTFPLMDASAVQVDDTGKRLNESLEDINDDLDILLDPEGNIYDGGEAHE